MYIVSGSGVNKIGDANRKETQAVDNIQEVTPSEIVVKHEITVKLDIEHFLNQIEKHDEGIAKSVASTVT